MYETYCSQNSGNCEDCSLVSYGLDCQNNPIATVDDNGYCDTCNSPVIHCNHWKNHINALNARINAAAESDTNRQATPEEINEFFSL